jgi:Berberine and berberine like
VGGEKAVRDVDGTSQSLRWCDESNCRRRDAISASQGIVCLFAGRVVEQTGRSRSERAVGERLLAGASRVFTAGAYVNFMEEEGEDRVRESYRGNYDRLVQIKRRYDPTNLFRLNQNIKP